MRTLGDMDEMLRSRLAPGERVLLRTRLHWGVLAAPLFVLAGAAMWATQAGALLFLGAAWSLTRSMAFEGTSVTAVTRRRLVMITVSDSGKSGAASIRWR